ncbi:cytochrome C oxidase subunit IV family protein [Marivirga sp. S37H4]|uniref:Cytochrome C oxidase subunit IV family protein n=1 Tax=Marivirga aurantiaca TaxID=2802615 RepID=A0A934WVJ6_9BACT|nr:cytochrome C oxidase subunit IV family protein [Marivirga aurantiaca]MBK6263722.1 cytochrome C oxidase subunit IV family protein [Marivirga aurantiaca]
MSNEETNNVQVIPEDKEKTKKIWRVAGILAVVTIIEFIFAFTMERGILLVSIFLGLTVVKAFYIVAEFMHLKHEQKTLIWSIIGPLVLIVWLIIALMFEGSAIFDVRY